MSGIIANYIFAYGFITDITNKRYFKGSTVDSDMETVKIKRSFGFFLNEVGWFTAEYHIEPKEQSKLYVFGERVLANEDNSFFYMDDNPKHSGFYKLDKDIFKAKLKNKDFINNEALINETEPSYLFFLNDKY